MFSTSGLQDFQRRDTLTNMVRLMASLSLFGSIATIIGTVALFRRQRSLWCRVVLFVALADGIDAMAKQGVRDPLDAGPTSFGCQLQGVVIQAATLASLLCAALVPLNLAACVFARSYAIRLQRNRQPILLALAAVSVFLAIVPLVTRNEHGARNYGDADLWCWLTYQSRVLQVVLWLVPVWLIFGLHVLLYGMVGYRLSTQRCQSHLALHPQAVQPHNYRRRFWRTALLSMSTVLLFWLPSNVMRLYALTHDGTLTYALALFLALLSPLRGFINFLLFLYIAISTKDRADEAVCGLGVWQCEQFYGFRNLESGGPMGAFTYLRQQLSDNPRLLKPQHGSASQNTRPWSQASSLAFYSRHSTSSSTSEKTVTHIQTPSAAHLPHSSQCSDDDQSLSLNFPYPATCSLHTTSADMAMHEPDQQSQLGLRQSLSWWRNNQSFSIVAQNKSALGQADPQGPPRRSRSIHRLGQFIKAKLPSASMPNIFSPSNGRAPPRVPPSEVPLVFLKVDPYPSIPHDELMPQLQEMLSYWPITRSLHSGRSQVTSISSLISSHWRVLLARPAAASPLTFTSSQLSHPVTIADSLEYSHDRDWLWVDGGQGDLVRLCTRFSFGPEPTLTLQWPPSTSSSVDFPDISHCDPDIAQVGVQRDS